MDARTKKGGGAAVAPVGLRYMEEFSCLGPECPDSCCHGWVIHFDRKAYKRLRQAMDHTKEDRKLFRDTVRREPDAQSEAHHARVKLGPDGYCPFLDTDGLCQVQRRFGEDHLGDVCRSYPRRLNAHGSRRELSGYLSCPATARACLTADGALDLVPISRPLEGVPLAAHVHSADPEARFLDELREVGFSVLGASDVPLAERLFLLSYFGQRVDEHGGPGELSAEDLAAEVDRLADPAAQETLRRQLRGPAPDLALPLGVLQTVLLAKHRSWRSFNSLLTACWQGYEGMQRGRGLKVELGAGQATVDATAIAGEYAALRDRVQARHGGLVDARLANWARNHWFQNWLVKAPSMSAYTQDLAVRYAVIRFLLVSHPAVRALAGEEEAGDRAEQVIDDAAVEVVYRFSRAVEHNREFLDRIRDAIEAAGLSGLALQLLLLRV